MSYTKIKKLNDSPNSRRKYSKALYQHISKSQIHQLFDILYKLAQQLLSIERMYGSEHKYNYFE